jgi:hypothetical protein
MLDLWGVVAMLEDLKPGRLSNCREETPSSDERGLRRLTSFSQIQSHFGQLTGVGTLFRMPTWSIRR